MTTSDRSLSPPHRAWWREGAITATAFVCCLVGGALRLDETLSAPPVATYVIAVTSCAVLPLRHRMTGMAVAVTTASGMLVAPFDLLLTPFFVAPAVIASYSFAVRSERRTTVVVLLTSAALLVASTIWFGNLSWQDVSRLAIVGAFPLVAGVLGHSTQNRRAYLAAVEERARRAEESRDSEARRRVAEERVRIARELHDLVAHQITLASAQAVVAAHLLDDRPEQTRKSLQQLVETTGNALDDLRTTVGLLRQSGDSAEPAEPAPGLSQIPALLESFRRAGLDVSVQEEGPSVSLPPGLDLTVYRIIQEALTNVTKHSGARSARVGLSWRRDRLTLTVADDGRGTSAALLPERPSGYGLIGMKERAAAAGGRLSVGGQPAGGFLVSTELPLPRARPSTQDSAEKVGDAP